MNSLRHLFSRIRSRVHRRTILAVGLGFVTLFLIYVAILYRQLENAFEQRGEAPPTRIYSDVTRIAPPMARAHVLERLAALGYGAGDGESVKLTPREANYPEYLVPENHAQGAAAVIGREITLRFDGAAQDSVLASIEVSSGEGSGGELPELFLEPELVATLSREKEIRTLVPEERIPHAVKIAVISVEDPRFLEHKGLDPRGLLRAVWVNFRTLSLAQGGSTITQQLVKNLMARRTKNLFLKANEVLLALILEARFSKERILERYLNEVYLGQVGSLEIHGVVEGAKHFFGKELDQLTLAEAAMMAGLIRGPGFYSPFRHWDRAVERQRWVLKRMAETGTVAEAEAEEALRTPVRLQAPQTSSNKAPYFVDFVKNELVQAFAADRLTEEEVFSRGLRVYTTLDLSVNAAGQRALAGGIASLEKRLKIQAPDRLEGALAAVEQSTGFIRALIGGRSYAQSTFNRILNMKRQVGSTFKPFVYLAAIEKGVDGNGADAKGVPYGPAYPALDAPWTHKFDEGRQTWTPRNYEKGHRGWIDLRTALAHSVNVVAAKVATDVGIDKVAETARALGITSELPEVPALSLGAAELSPVDLLTAYAAIANHGSLDRLTVIRGVIDNDGARLKRWVPEPKERVSRGGADLMTDMLQSVFLEGTAAAAAAMGFDRPAAGKTGTTSNHRDAWFAGYTPELTAVVWVGMDQSAPQQAAEGAGPKAAKPKPIQLTGAGSALPIWVDFMKEALASVPPAPFPPSPDLTSARVDRYSGKMAESSCPDDQTTLEKYASGREPREFACASSYPASE